jgi:nitroreductase
MGTTRSDASSALTAAVDTARLAPSVHNTQPWHWQQTAETLRLYADRDRQLSVADPEGILLTQSCGAALHHARISLAAEGWQADVRRLPDPAKADLLAEITVIGQGQPDPIAVTLVRAATQRHTDRRPLSDEPVEQTALDLLATAAAAEDTHLYLLHDEQIVELAAAAGRADYTGASDQEYQAELAQWVGGSRPEATGIPDSAVPNQPPPTRVPGRFFGQPGTLPVDDRHDRAARYALLHGEGDTPQAWLRAGEALSAVWLTAIGQQLSLLPISAVVENLATRERLRHLLSNLGYPYLALRVGHPDTHQPEPPATPRMTVDEILDTDERRSP